MLKRLISQAIQLAVLLGLIWPTTALAERQYWVSIASFVDQGSADKAMQDAASGFSQSLSVIGSSTDKGYFYRVAAGPFMSRDAAQESVLDAQSVGYTGAWVWSQDSTVVDTYGTSTAYSFSEDDLLLNDSSDTYDLGPVDVGANAPGNDDYQRSKTHLPQLVEEAPASYQLNKLRRNP